MAMDLDDLLPRTERPKPKDLSLMAVEDLEAYISSLESEIARARAAIDAKRSVRASAEAFFKR